MLDRRSGVECMVRFARRTAYQAVLRIATWTCGVLVALAVVLSTPASRADDAPQRKVALLVAVNKYLKPGFKPLEFCEEDVQAIGAELQKLGFEVTILLGSGKGEQQATRANIDAAARRMVAPLTTVDLALVMLSGHGQQLDPNPGAAAPADPDATLLDKSTSFFCPVDAVADEPATQFAISLLTDDILAKNVGTRLVVVDACRDVPPQSKSARKSQGIQGRTISLPEDTGVFFSCRAGQFSYVGNALGHSLFSYCLLDGLKGAAARDGELAWADLVAHVNRRMAQPDMKQFMLPALPQVPIPAGAVPHTVLGKLDVRPVVTTPAPRPIVPTIPAPTPATVPDSALDGKQAGEVRSFTDLGVKFCWCPAGSFTMGSPASEADRSSDEEQVNVTLSRGFWLGQTEVSQGLWQSVMGTTPWAGKDYVQTGANYPAVYISHGLGSDGTVEPDSATEFCRKLTARERAAGRLPSGWSYTLPTEAQWEYGCRAGTTGPYNGDGTGVLSDYAWYNKNALDIGEKYAHLVGQKKPNRWGLYDLHGNVYEWCQDLYGEKLPGGRNPSVSSGGSNRVNRGGGWLTPAGYCRSAIRLWYDPSLRYYYLGFRCALSPSGE